MAPGVCVCVDSLPNAIRVNQINAVQILATNSAPLPVRYCQSLSFMVVVRGVCVCVFDNGFRVGNA